MKKLLPALMLVLPAQVFALDYLQFAVDDTLKCSHPTVDRKEAKAEFAVNPTKQGDTETTRVRVFYKGMIKPNSMLIEYRVMEASTKLMQAKILEDTSGTPAKSCTYFKGWQEIKD